ncbi:MAG: sensor histidine kinase [Acidimicrobiia bacterium]
MMIESASGRFQAPISYVDVRRSYNTFRAVGGFLIAVVALVAWSRGFDAAPWIATGGTVIVIDAMTRLDRGTSTLPLLLLDVTVIGSMVLTAGHSAVIEGTAFVYILTAAMLLLPLRFAASVLVYAAAFVLPVAWWAPLVASTEATEGPVAFQLGAVAVLTGLIAELLYSAGRALYEAGERHRHALASERRAVQIKDEFVSMVSHELRTPLTSIAGFTDTLRETWSRLDPNEIEEFLHIMRRETSHLANLVEDILVIPRLEAGRLKLDRAEIDLRRHSFEIGEIVFQDGEAEFSVAVPGGVMVHADPVRLKQILRNLLENARKYGGDQVLVEGEQQGDMYLLVVSDNGPGVGEPDRDRIFDHFEQGSKGDARSDQGVGLGLPIARKLARAMGGDLWFEPRFPTGSRFCVTIRLSRIAQLAGVREPAGAEPTTSA